jgi:hypothetical protein
LQLAQKETKKKREKREKREKRKNKGYVEFSKVTTRASLY